MHCSDGNSYMHVYSGILVVQRLPVQDEKPWNCQIGRLYKFVVQTHWIESSPPTGSTGNTAPWRTWWGAKYQGASSWQTEIHEQGSGPPWRYLCHATAFFDSIQGLTSWKIHDIYIYIYISFFMYMVQTGSTTLSLPRAPAHMTNHTHSLSTQAKAMII